MAIDLGTVRDYQRGLGEESEEGRFLRRIPWVIDAGAQPPEYLLRTLKFESERFLELPRAVRFSLLTPLWKTPPRLLRELILSVRCQSYQDWELLLVDDASPTRDHLEIAREWAERDSRIKLFELEHNLGISGARNHAIAHASGDFLAVLDHDDLLHPSALGVFARALNTEPDTNFLFSNECKITENSARVLHYLTKPSFDLFTLLRNNYVCHFTAVERELLMAARRDGRVFRSEYDGCEDHDLFLRIALTGQARPSHIPLFLYYWRMTADSTAMVFASKPEIPRRRQAMIAELMPEIHPGAHWVYTPPGSAVGNACPSVKLTALAATTRPSLLVVIPFKDQIELTLTCLEALERQEHDLDLKVVLVNNRSSERATMLALGAWIDRPRRLTYVVMDHDAPFNFNRMNNLAIARHGRDRALLLFLNNDVELVSPDALQTMAMQLLADERCGFVGLRLMYPDGGGVQHGGVRLRPEIFGSGYFTLQHADGPEDYVRDEKTSFAVTFACAMTRRATFDTLGGLDEVLFPNSFGDADLCARAVAAGYHNSYFGTLWGYHHESKSRGFVSEDVDYAALSQRHGGTFAHWRLRNLCLTLDYPWRLDQLTLAAPAAGAAPARLLPFRYVMADRVNQVLKLGLGPAHRWLRGSLLRSWQALASIKRRWGQPRTPIYRPRLARQERTTAPR